MRELARIDPPRAEPLVLWPNAGRMHALRATAERVARGEIGVLLVGESGVGKEVLAELVHSASGRAHRTLVRIDCGAPSAALSAELESAEGSTVLLDEVGDLSGESQGRLLRVMEERDVRVIAITSGDLNGRVRDGLFRSDLFFRLDAARLEVPPLRERRDEIVPLASAFVARATGAMGRASPPRLVEAARAALLEYDWPGNVRELRHAMEWAALLCDEVVDPAHLPARVLDAVENQSRRLRDDLDDVERRRIADALDRCAGSQSGAARMLGISRTTLLARLDRYGITRPRKPRRSAGA